MCHGFGVGIGFAFASFHAGGLNEDPLFVRDFCLDLVDRASAGKCRPWDMPM